MGGQQSIESFYALSPEQIETECEMVIEKTEEVKRLLYGDALEELESVQNGWKTLPEAKITFSVTPIAAEREAKLKLSLHKLELYLEKLQEIIRRQKRDVYDRKLLSDDKLREDVIALTTLKFGVLSSAEERLRNDWVDAHNYDYAPWSLSIRQIFRNGNKLFPRRIARGDGTIIVNETCLDWWGLGDLKSVVIKLRGPKRVPHVINTDAIIQLRLQSLLWIMKERHMIPLTKYMNIAPRVLTRLALESATRQEIGVSGSGRGTVPAELENIIYEFATDRPEEKKKKQETTADDEAEERRVLRRSKKARKAKQLAKSNISRLFSVR